MSEPLSQTQLKNRLLGAALLVVLAALLIPLFLGEPKDADLELPTSSSTDFESRIRPLDTVDGAKEGDNSANKQGLEEAENAGLVLKKIDSLQAKKVQTTQNATKKPVLKKLPEKITKPAKPVKPSKTKTAANSKPKPTAKESAEAVSPQQAGWVVQAGIFSKVENAKSIARILKTNGHSPKISSTKANYGTATRVWLGPFASKEEAQALSSVIEQQTGHGGYVAQYPFKS